MNQIDRRSFAAASATAGVAFLGISTTRAAAAGEVSHNSAAIHQEILFVARSARIYDALTNPVVFDKVVRASAAMKSMSSTQLGHAPTQIDAQAGGAFALFGGYISGRNIELIPENRIVQAWRVGNWDAGVYSIAKFVLSEIETGTRLVFDHTGFPSEAADHLAEGWHANYWEPLAKVLESP